MLFHSTRGKDKDKTFEQVLMQGLAKMAVYTCQITGLK